MRNYLRNLERHHLQRTMKGKMEQAERAVLEMLEKHLEKKGIAVDRESGEIYRPKEPDVDES